VKSPQRCFNISLIGAGKVGTTLAGMLLRSGNRIVAVVSRDKRSARKCGVLVRCRNYSDDPAVIPAGTNLIVIAVPDRSIRSVAESLAQLPDLRAKGLFVFHTSGAMTSDELELLTLKGATVFSLHPVQTFPKQKSLRDQIRAMNGITYGIEGSNRSLRTAKLLVRQLGGIPLIVPKEAKILYHCACVIASNYAVTLVGAVDALAGQFTKQKSNPFRALIETSIANAMESGAGKALTGPIVRGDAEIISRHLKSIRDPDIRSVYRSLGMYALKLAAVEGRIAPEEVQHIQQLFRESD
jgi:predicted short-subunit dehydrogenase-like oxidoreductase (DUF2520 family)